MYFEATEELIKAVTPYIAWENIIKSNFGLEPENRSKIKIDHVILDSENNVGFEVVDNEITVFWFNEHSHFEDYSSQPKEGEEDYIERAEEFLVGFFQFQIRKIELRKNDKWYCTKYYIVYDDGRKDEFIGGSSGGLIRRINPFAKKTRKETIIKYDKVKGSFITR